MGGSTSYLAHADAVGSMVMETDQTGAVTYDIRYYPWGQLWLTAGTRPSTLFAGLEWQVNDPVIPSATREYNDGLGRWMTPDPDNAGADVGDSQSWNMYSYVGDNPTSRNDPSGEDYRVCQEGENGDSANCTTLTDQQYDTFIEQNKNTLTFAGSKIFANGTQIGTSEYIPTIDPSVAFGLHAVGEFANAEIKKAAVNMAINGAFAGAGAAIGAGIDWLAASGETSAGVVPEVTELSGGLNTGTTFNEGAGLLNGEVAGMSQEAVMRAATRGVTKEEIAEALTHVPKQYARRPAALVFNGRAARVIVSRITGKIITVIRFSSPGAPSAF